MGFSWGRKSSNFCDRCAEAFPDLVDGACSDGTIHEQVRRRLVEYDFCQRCFDTYRRTAELCRRVVREPPGSVDRLLDTLRELREA